MDPDIKTPEIIRKILTTGTCSTEELDHLYRHLSKQTHPDLTGNDGEAFIRLRETYRKAREQIDTLARVESPPFDPFRIIRESGFPVVPSPRIHLYIVLRRFFQAGFHNRKVRDNPGSLRRSAEVLEAIRYWSTRYNPALGDIIDGYLTVGADFMNTTKQFKDFTFSRKLFLQGTDLFFRYQASGRDTTRSLAEEKLALSAVIMGKTAGASHPIVPFARWFLEEIKKPPVLLEGL